MRVLALLPATVTVLLTCRREGDAIHDVPHLFVLCKQRTLVQRSLVEWQDHKQGRAGQGRAGQGRAGQSQTGQGRNKAG